MMKISIYAVLTLSNKLSHTVHCVISSSRVLGCHHFIDEKAEMSSGKFNDLLSCLVTLLTDKLIGESRLVPKTRPKVLATTRGWLNSHTQNIALKTVLESQEHFLLSFFLKTRIQSRGKFLGVST